MPSIKIGDSAIIGAGAVATHNVATYEIVEGVPARHIGFHFNQDIILKLEALQLWD